MRWMTVSAYLCVCVYVPVLDKCTCINVYRPPYYTPFLKLGRLLQKLQPRVVEQDAVHHASEILMHQVRTAGLATQYDKHALHDRDAHEVVRLAPIEQGPGPHSRLPRLHKLEKKGVGKVGGQLVDIAQQGAEREDGQAIGMEVDDALHGGMHSSTHFRGDGAASRKVKAGDGLTWGFLRMGSMTCGNQQEHPMLGKDTDAISIRPRASFVLSCDRVGA